MRRALVVPVLLMAVLAPGCGNEQDETRYVNSPGLLTQRFVDRFEPGSPNHALAEWVRALVFNDAIRAAAYYDPKLGVRPFDLARARAGMQPFFFDWFKSPKIGRARRSGDTARISGSVVLDRPEAQGGELRFAYTFELKRIGGQWKLTNGVLPGAQTRD